MKKQPAESEQKKLSSNLLDGGTGPADVSILGAAKILPQSRKTPTQRTSGSPAEEDHGFYDPRTGEVFP